MPPTALLVRNEHPLNRTHLPLCLVSPKAHRDTIPMSHQKLSSGNGSWSLSQDLIVVSFSCWALVVDSCKFTIATMPIPIMPKGIPMQRAARESHEISQVHQPALGELGKICRQIDQEPSRLGACSASSAACNPCCASVMSDQGQHSKPEQHTAIPAPRTKKPAILTILLFDLYPFLLLRQLLELQATSSASANPSQSCRVR